MKGTPDYQGLYFSDYEFPAAKTATYKNPMYLPLGLAEEVGELLHEYARCERKGVEIDLEALRSECGDVLWVLSQICRENGFSLEEAARENIAKLKSRSESGTIHAKVGR
jgi:NTP pyrophosphatase (non-canonical NTP hydrolase)